MSDHRLRAPSFLAASIGAMLIAAPSALGVCAKALPPLSATPKRTFTAPAKVTSPTCTYRVTMVTSEGTMKLLLDPKAAPATVNSFVFLARKRFFDGLTFHRVLDAFVIQGGDPLGNGTGGPGYTIPDEFPSRPFKVGDLAMAKTPDPNSGGSQFFVITGRNGAALPLHTRASVVSPRASPSRSASRTSRSPATRPARRVSGWRSAPCGSRPPEPPGAFRHDAARRSPSHAVGPARSITGACCPFGGARPGSQPVGRGVTRSARCVVADGGWHTRAAIVRARNRAIPLSWEREMKIAVCVKDVPDAGPNRRMDPGTLRIDRSGERALNAFDLTRSRRPSGSRRPPARAKWSWSRWVRQRRSTRSARALRWAPTGSCSSPMRVPPGSDLVATSYVLAKALEREAPSW